MLENDTLKNGTSGIGLYGNPPGGFFKFIQSDIAGTHT